MTAMKPVGPRGFSMVELMFAVGLLGLIFAMSMPAYHSYRKSHELKGAAENIAAQLRLAREKAIATGVSQLVHFNYGWSGGDYHVHPGGTALGAIWKLPRGVTYHWGTGTNWQYHMTRDGRCLQSGLIIIQNARGLRDTISVQMSGLVLN